MYFHALKQSAEQDNATPLESHSVGFEIQMRTEELVALFQVHLLYFCYGKVKKVKTLRIYLPKQCPFGPIPQSTWRRRKNPDFLWAGNRWRRGQRDLGLGSALTMLTTLVQKSFCQKTIHGPRRLGSQTHLQMRAQLHTHRYRYNCRDLLCLYGSIAHTYPCIYSQVRERRSLYLNALKFAATTEPPTTTTAAVSRNWDIHKILPGNDLQSMRILNALHSCRS